MKSVFFGLLVFGTAFVSIQFSHAQSVTWGSAFGDSLRTSQGDSLGDDFQFELGVFRGDFQPTDANWSLWEADWEGFDRATAQNEGFSSAVGFINRSVAIDENGQTTSTAFEPAVQDHDFRGADVYLWVYRNDKSTEGGNEFALITDPGWKFPENVSPTAPPLEFRLALSNEAILGVSKNDTVALQTVAVGTPIPEPSASIMALFGGLLLLHRRKRPA